MQCPKLGSRRVLPKLFIVLAPQKRGFAEEALAIGVNIKKNGVDPPLKPASEYPEWLSILRERGTTLYDVDLKLEERGEESLNFEELLEYNKLKNRASIKELNSQKAKK